MNRSEILDEAKRLTTGDRQAEYGEPWRVYWEYVFKEGGKEQLKNPMDRGRVTINQPAQRQEWSIIDHSFFVFRIFTI